MTFDFTDREIAAMVGAIQAEITKAEECGQRRYVTLLRSILFKLDPAVFKLGGREQ